MFDHAGNAFVSAYRYYKDKECRTVDVHIEYIATPDLSKKTLLIVDPMLATGESMELAWKLRHQGDAGQVADSLCHSQPAGRRASGKAVPWR